MKKINRWKTDRPKKIDTWLFCKWNLTRQHFCRRSCRIHIMNIRIEKLFTKISDKFFFGFLLFVFKLENSEFRVIHKFLWRIVSVFRSAIVYYNSRRPSLQFKCARSPRTLEPSDEVFFLARRASKSEKKKKWPQKYRPAERNDKNRSVLNHPSYFTFWRKLGPANNKIPTIRPRRIRKIGRSTGKKKDGGKKMACRFNENSCNKNIDKASSRGSTVQAHGQNNICRKNYEGSVPLLQFWFFARRTLVRIITRENIALHKTSASRDHSQVYVADSCVARAPKPT